MMNRRSGMLSTVICLMLLLGAAASKADSEGSPAWYVDRREALLRNAPQEVNHARQAFQAAQRAGNAEALRLWGGWYLRICARRTLEPGLNEAYDALDSDLSGGASASAESRLSALLGTAAYDLVSQRTAKGFERLRAARELASRTQQPNLQIEVVLTSALENILNAQAAVASAELVDAMQQPSINAFQLIEARTLLANAALYATATSDDLRRVAERYREAKVDLIGQGLLSAALEYGLLEASATARSGNGKEGLRLLLVLEEDFARRGLDASAPVTYRIARSADLSLALALEEQQGSTRGLCKKVVAGQIALPGDPNSGVIFERLAVLCRAAARDPDVVQAIKALENSASLPAEVASAAGEESLWNSISTAYSLIGAYQDAYRSALQFRRASLKRIGLANDAARAEIEAKYQVTVQRKENELLRTKQAAETQRWWAVLGILGCALLALAVASFVLRTQIRQRRRLSELAGNLERANDDLSNANKKLNELNASRTRLVAAACHDLRQPAHALGMMAEVAAEQVDGAGRGAIEAIRRSAGSLSDLLDALFDHSRLESERYTPAISAVSLGELLLDLRTQFTVTAMSKGLTLRIDDTTATVRSDPQLLRRMVINLLSNAIKYTAAGSVTITTVRKGPSWVVTVSDTGPGIPLDQQEAAFSEYVRLESSNGTDGLGIGLAIVKRSAVLLGHRLELVSTPGKGTSFSLHLVAIDDVTVVPDPVLALSGEGRIVGLVDDDPQILQAMTELFKMRGYVPYGADSLEALQARLADAGVARPHIVLSDLHLAKGSSLERLTQLTGEGGVWWQVPTVVVTGDLSPEVVDRCEALGITIAYKPLKAPKLFQLIETCLAKQANPAMG